MKVFTQEIIKIVLIPNYDKRMESIDSIKTYTYETNKDLVSEKEETKCNNRIKRRRKLLSLMMLQK